MMSTPTSRFSKVSNFSKTVGFERETKRAKCELKADDALFTFKNFEVGWFVRVRSCAALVIFFTTTF